jgi:hypothetical protein
MANPMANPTENQGELRMGNRGMNLEKRLFERPHPVLNLGDRRSWFASVAPNPNIKERRRVHGLT